MIEWINSIGDIWARYFVLAIVQNSLFLGIIFFLLHYFRNASAKVKYNIALLGIFKLLLPPIVSVPILNSPLPRYVSFENMAGSNALSGSSAASVTTVAAYNLSGMLFILWLSLIAAFIIVTLISSVQLRFLLRSSLPIENIQVGRRSVTLYKSPRITSPITLGIIPRKIYVPNIWNNWAEDCRQLILDHEIAHIKRYDGLVQILQIIVKAIYFFHPLVWILNKKIIEYREMACDDMSVAGTKGSAIIYSRYLIKIAEYTVQARLSCPSASALIRQKNNLISRIKYQMKESTMKTQSSRKIRGVLVGLTLLAVAFSLNFTSANPAKFEAAGATKIVIKVENDDNIKVNGNKLMLPKLGKYLDAEFQDLSAIQEVHVIALNKIKMKTIAAIHNALRERGLLNINYIAEKGSGSPLVLPPKGDEKKLQQVQKEAPKNICTIHLSESGEITVDDKKYEMYKLTDIMKKMLYMNENIITVFQADENANYGDYLAVLNSIKEAKVTRISVVQN